MSKSKKTASKSMRQSPSQASLPWVIGGIDYGPALVPIADLAAWAFDLAAKDVNDWPEGRRQVASARRFVQARVHGQRGTGTPTDDVLFTAGLLARIFETDLGLGMSEMVAILDELGLPTEVVPLMPRAQPSASIQQRSNVLPFPAPRHAAAEPHSPGCDFASRYRNAA